MLKTQGILKVLLQNHQKPREFLVIDLGIYLKNISVFTLVFVECFPGFSKKTWVFAHFFAKTIKTHWCFLIFQWLTVLLFNRKPLKTGVFSLFYCLLMVPNDCLKDNGRSCRGG